MVSFDTKADFSKYGLYKIVAYGTDNKDDYLLNDTLTAYLENDNINETLKVFPNPFTDNFTININSPIDDKLQISITNESGEKLYEIEKIIISGVNSFIISDLKLLPSIYYLKVQGASINQTIPILKIGR